MVHHLRHSAMKGTRMKTSRSKSRRVSSPTHLKFIRTLPCCICGAVRVEAHHLLRPWEGERGMGMKSGDQNTIPLCPTHHRLLHNTGDELRFFRERKGDERFGKFTAIQCWLKSPVFKKG